MPRLSAVGILVVYGEEDVNLVDAQRVMPKLRFLVRATAGVKLVAQRNFFSVSSGTDRNG